MTLMPTSYRFPAWFFRNPIPFRNRSMRMLPMLAAPSTSLSGGQQQRLCIARAIAVNPNVVLMDEPCSALDPIATQRIEDLMRELATQYTIVIVTHNLQQAARVSDRTGFMLAGDDGIGRLVEYRRTDELFMTPKDERTEAYITGRFG